MTQLRLLFLFLLSVALARPAVAQTSGNETSPSRPAIFREIHSQTFGTITLGETFAQRAGPIAVNVAPGVFDLVYPHGRFADTDSLLVTVDSANRVRQLRFVYRAGKVYEEAVGDYESTLGSAAPSRTRVPDGALIQRAAWADGRTHLTVQLRMKASDVRVSAVLEDRSGQRP